MGDNEAFDKLKLLSKREFEILRLYCEFHEYKEIAKILFISDSAVKNYMGRIYVKLGLDQLPRRARFLAMGEIYCPALHDFERSNDFNRDLIAVDTEPEPISQGMMKMVEDDNGGPLEIIEGKTNKFVPPSEKNNHGYRRRPNPFSIGFVIISLIAILYMGYSIFNRFFGTPATQHGSQSSEVPVQATSDEENTAEMTEASQSVVASTNTEVIPTESPTPRATATPQAAILFEGDFEDGLSDAWEVISGNPVVVNGMLTADQNTWVAVGDPTWTDYSVEFRASSKYAYYNWGSNFTAVRMNGIENMYVYEWVVSQSRWHIVENGDWNEVPQSEFRPGSGFVEYKIVVKGNSITTYIGGIQKLAFFDDKFSHGRVGIMITEETLIDNFIVKEILD